MRYEITTGGGRAAGEPAWAKGYRDAIGLATRPKTCSACRRAPATVITAELDCRLALCHTCADPVLSERMRQTRARLARTEAVLAEAQREREARGIVGLAVPYLEPARIRDGVWEQIERGAFEESVVHLTLGHRGPYLGNVRAFSLPHGLFFESDDVPEADTVLRSCTGVSIEFHRLAESTEPYRDGRLRRLTSARLSRIAIVPYPEKPVYGSTWCGARSTANWERVYQGLRVAI